MSEEFELKQIIVRADLPQQIQVQAFVGKKLEPLNCSPKTRIQFRIAVDEIFSNIVLHGGLRKDETITVLMHVEKEPRSVVITFIDGGNRFDPLSADDPDVTAPAYKRSAGGLGLFMLKRIMDEVLYEYRDEKNILTIRKNI